MILQGLLSTVSDQSESVSKGMDESWTNSDNYRTRKVNYKERVLKLQVIGVDLSF
jgi:hypothetical protein